MSEPASTAPWWAHAYEAFLVALAGLLGAFANRLGRRKKEPVVRHSDSESGELRRWLDEDRMREIAREVAVDVARDVAAEVEKRAGDRMDRQDEQTQEIRRDLGTVRVMLGELRGGFEAMADQVKRAERVIDRTLGLE